MPPRMANEMEAESSTPGEYSTPQSAHEAPTSEDEPALTKGDLPPHLSGGKSGTQSGTQPFTSGDNFVSSNVEHPTDTINVAVPTPHTLTLPPTVGHLPSDSRVLVSSSTASAHASTTPQSTIDREVARLRNLIDKVSPQALHDVLESTWREFVFIPYDEDHIVYILRACLKNSNAAVLQRSLRDTLANTGNRQWLVNHSLQYANAAQILSRVPHQILDQVVAHRLHDAPAKSIVNWLAEAGRLGYSRDDIIIEGDESILPNGPQQPPQSSYRNAPDRQQQGPESQNQTQSRQGSPAFAHHNGMANGTPPSRSTTGDAVNLSGNLICSDCGFQAQTRVGLSYHKDKSLCRKGTPEKRWKESCLNCGQVFPHKQGHNYHVKRLVCYGGKLEDNVSPEVQDAVRTRLGRLPLDRSQEPTISEPPTMIRPTRLTPNPPTAQAESAQSPLPTQPSAPAVQVQIQRPPMHTPVRLSATPQISERERAANITATNPIIQAVHAIDPSARVSPSQLTPARKAEMERQIAAEDQRYKNALAAIDPQLPQADQDKRRISLRNGNATKKSQIRKSFGVTLRMRPKDKAASRVVAESSPMPTGTPPLVNSQVSTPSPGFSPINGPATYQPSPQSNPQAPPFRPETRRSHLARPIREDVNPRTSPRPDMTGFGVVRTQNPLPGQPGGYRIPTSTPKSQSRSRSKSPRPSKRQRTSSDGEQQRSALANLLATTSIPPLERTRTTRGQTGGAGLSMMEARSEDAVRKYPKKVPVGEAQAKWEALQPRKDGTGSASGYTELGKRKASDVGMDGATDTGRANSGSREEVIVIDSDTESGGRSADAGVGAAAGGVNGIGNGEVADADQPLPSTEDTESDAS